MPADARTWRHFVDGALFGVFLDQGEVCSAGRRRDLNRAIRAVEALRAGVVWVNHMQPTHVGAPWGGFKQSGYGRELGPWGLEASLETKQVHVNPGEAPIGWY